MNTIKYPMSRLQIFNACRAVANIKFREFASGLNPPVTVQGVVEVLQGRSKSNRIENALISFITQHARAINLNPQYLNERFFNRLKIIKNNPKHKKGVKNGRQKNRSQTT